MSSEGGDLRTAKKVGQWDREATQWAHHESLGTVRHAIEEFVRAEIRNQTQQSIPDGPIVDLGAGAGNAAYFDPEVYARVVAFDFSSGMLRENRRATQKVQGALAETLPFPDRSMVLCTSFFTLRYLRYAEHIEMLKEIHRVTAEGGRFLLIDFTHNNRYEHQYAKFSPTELAKVARSLGFEDVEARRQLVTAEQIPADLSIVARASYEAEIGVLTGVKRKQAASSEDLAKVSADYIPEKDGEEIPIFDRQKFIDFLLGDDD